MKFPKVLSKERISLLSPEDRKIYEAEHAYDNVTTLLPPRLFEDVDMFNETINEDVDYESIARGIVNEELENIYEEFFSDVMSKTDYSNALTNYTQLLDNQLVEGAEGLDAYAWIRGLEGKLGWLGKLAGVGLAGLATGISALIIAGKDKLAFVKLKKYMNRLVEIIDQGIYKKRSFFSKLFNRKNRGEHNIACFRSIQEMADRSMTNAVMNAAHKLGFFGTGQMMNVNSGDAPQSGSGLDDFKNNVLSKLNVIVPTGKI